MLVRLDEVGDSGLCGELNRDFIPDIRETVETK